MIIIGITGTNGAGKGTIVNYLSYKKGFIHYSVSAYLAERLKKEGKEINRRNLINIANELRANFGPNFLVETLYKQAVKTKKNCIIESIRNINEVYSLKNKGDFYLFAVDADAKIRFNRIRKRASNKDIVSFHQFIETEKSEMQSKDINKENIAQCIEKADYKFNNNKSLKYLYKQVDSALYEIENKNS